MLLTLVSTVISMDVAEHELRGIYDTSPDLADNCAQTGFERSSVALLLLGLLTFAMGIGAAFGRSRPAAVALIVIGVVVLGITLLVDLPASDDAGLIGRDYAEASRVGGRRAVVRADRRSACRGRGALAVAAAERLALTATFAVFSEALLALCFSLCAARVGLPGRLSMQPHRYPGL